MQYPGRAIKIGERDAAVVAALAERLNAVLVLQPGEVLRPDADAPVFDARMESAVKLFQSRSTDGLGNPLVIDGAIGAITWAALFGDDRVPAVSTTDDALLAHVLGVAATELAKPVREVPPNSNRGPVVEGYLKSVGLDGGNSWCAAFVYWCFVQSAHDLGRSNPVFRTGACLAHWNGAPSRGAKRLLPDASQGDPSLLQPGMIFIMDHGGGFGHTGLIERVEGGMITTIEGNSNNDGSREGIGVFRLNRKVNSINKGFIDYRGL